MMNPTGIDYITLYDLHPLDLIPIAAAAGAETLTIPAVPVKLSHGGSFSILRDANLRHDIMSCLAEHGVRLGMIDGLVIMPGMDVGEYERGLADFAEMGVTTVNSVSFDDLDRSIDSFGRLAQVAAGVGMTVLIECCPALTVRTLGQALSIVQQIALPNFRLLIDTMHVSRTGEAGTVASLDPALIGYVQVSDAPLAMPASNDAYMEEAMYERMLPGEGELPLEAILRHVPDGVIVGAEIPQRSRLRSGWSKLQCAKTALTGTRRLLEQARR